MALTTNHGHSTSMRLYILPGHRPSFFFVLFFFPKYPLLQSYQLLCFRKYQTGNAPKRIPESSVPHGDSACGQTTCPACNGADAVFSIRRVNGLEGPKGFVVLHSFWSPLNVEGRRCSYCYTRASGRWVDLSAILLLSQTFTTYGHARSSFLRADSTSWQKLSVIYYVQKKGYYAGVGMCRWCL